MLFSSRNNHGQFRMTSLRPRQLPITKYRMNQLIFPSYSLSKRKKDPAGKLNSNANSDEHLKQMNRVELLSKIGELK